MKSWFEADASRAASQPGDFVPFSAEADDFVPLSARAPQSGSDGAAGDVTSSAEEQAARAAEAEIAAAYERGLADARAERAELDSGEALRAFAALDAAAAQLEGRARREAAQWSSAAVELALVIAERVVRANVAADRDALASRIIAAVDSVSDENGARLFVAVADLAWLEANAESRLAELRAARAIEIEADPTLDAGEFRLEHRGAVVDARVEAMLDRFREELTELPMSAGGDE